MQINNKNQSFSGIYKVDSNKLNNNKQFNAISNLTNFCSNPNSVIETLSNSAFSNFVFFVFPDELDKHAESLMDKTKITFDKLA